MTEANWRTWKWSNYNDKLRWFCVTTWFSIYNNFEFPLVFPGVYIYTALYVLLCMTNARTAEAVSPCDNCRQQNAHHTHVLRPAQATRKLRCKWTAISWKHAFELSGIRSVLMYHHIAHFANCATIAGINFGEYWIQSHTSNILVARDTPCNHLHIINGRK